MIDLSPFPALRYHSAGTRPERESSREECCRRYGREEIDTGRMYRFLRAEIEELVRRNQAPLASANPRPVPAAAGAWHPGGAQARVT